MMQAEAARATITATTTRAEPGVRMREGYAKRPTKLRCGPTRRRRRLCDNHPMRRLAFAFICALGGLVMAPAGCGSDRAENPAGVGNHCVKDTDCKTNLCYLGPGG